MKMVLTETIGDYQTIRAVTAPAVDPAAAEKKVCCQIPETERKMMTKSELQKLFHQHIVYSSSGHDSLLVQDEQALETAKKLADLKPHEKLLADLEILPGWRGVEFWLKDGIWKKQKIDQIGLAPPAGFILPDNLSEDSRKEISTQEETERMAALTAEQRENEKAAALNALKAEAIRKRELAELTDERFDAKAWYQAETAKVDSKYAGF